MYDFSNHIIADIKEIIFDNRDYKSPITFESWVGDSHSFIVKDFDGQKYCISVTKENI